MQRMKKYLTVFICFLLLFPSAPFATVSIAEETDEGEFSGKEEVVYATLSPTGKNQEVYVVNSFDVIEEGKITDYGNYNNLKNLTDLSELEQSGEKVEMTVSEGKFYYQGDLEETFLPWEVELTYFLDGEETQPEALAGQAGELQILLETTQNEKVDAVFFENYLLQISIPFDGDNTRNVETEEGTLANAGKDILVNFTVMPEEEASFAVTADVQDFELSGIDINAIPQNMSIEAPDTDEFTDDLVTLADALQEIDEGVLELQNGTRELHEGVGDLREGSATFREGITALSGGSTELVSGSASIKEALAAMDHSLSSELDTIDFDDFSMVADGLNDLADGLREVVDGLTVLKDNYTNAFGALDGAMEGIPTMEISEEDIYALYQSDADSDTLDALLEVYEASLIAKGTYNEMKQVFTAIEDTFEEITPSLSIMASSIDEVVEGIQGMDTSELTSGMSELQEGIAALSTNYEDFHDGLITYTNGVDDLASGYAELDNGISELEKGTGELANGVPELREGTQELAEATSEMPDQVTEEIDEILSQYDGSDFEVKSFVSEKNEDVNTVQFVLTTEPIELDEEVEEEPVKEERSIWQKFLDLFK